MIEDIFINPADKKKKALFFDSHLYPDDFLKHKEILSRFPKGELVKRSLNSLFDKGRGNFLEVLQEFDRTTESKKIEGKSMNLEVIETSFMRFD